MVKNTLITNFIILVLFLPCRTIAQVVNIPDANFKTYLLENSSINTNVDSEIQVSEAAAVTILDVPYLDITDLTGIEAFTSITNLNCYGNSISSLATTNNLALTHLFCYNNLLTTLDVSSNSQLKFLGCGSNSLTSVNVSNNTALVDLNCSDNWLTSLDVSSNNLLTSLYCGNNSLVELDIRNGNNVNMQWTFSAIDNPDLNCISVDDEVWANANMSFGKDATAVYSIDCDLVGIDKNELNPVSIFGYANTVTIKGNGLVTIVNAIGQQVYRNELEAGIHEIDLPKGIFHLSLVSERNNAYKKVYSN